MTQRTRKDSADSPQGLVADVRKAAIKRVDMNPPAGLTPTEKQLWSEVVSTRDISEWKQSDRVLLRSYVRSWTAINTLEQDIDAEGSTIRAGTQANPKLQALSARMKHMNILFLRLGLSGAAVNQASRSAQANAAARQTAARNAMNEDEDDDLLARP